MPFAVSGDDDLAAKIENCAREQWCGSPYCRECRNVMAANLNERVWKRVHNRHNGREHSANEHFRWATVLNAVTEWDECAVEQAIQKARSLLNILQQRF